MIPPPLLHTRSWSRAGLVGDSRYRHTRTSSSPLHKLVPKSKLESLLGVSAVPLYERVQKALEAEEKSQHFEGMSKEHSSLRPSFYFRCQSRKDLQRPPADGPALGNYTPNFSVVFRRSPICWIGRAAFGRSSHFRHRSDNLSVTFAASTMVSKRKTAGRVRRRPILK